MRDIRQGKRSRCLPTQARDDVVVFSNELISEAEPREVEAECADPTLLERERSPSVDSDDHTAYEEPASEERASSARFAPYPRTKQPTDHIPRPPNAFILFRSDFWDELRRSSNGERNHRNISRMAATQWRELPPARKRQYVARAQEEKRLHKEKFPGYKYRPRPRETKGAAEGSRQGKEAQRNGGTSSRKAAPVMQDRPTEDPGAASVCASASPAPDNPTSPVPEPFVPTDEIPRLRLPPVADLQRAREKAPVLARAMSILDYIMACILERTGGPAALHDHDRQQRLRMQREVDDEEQLNASAWFATESSEDLQHAFEMMSYRPSRDWLTALETYVGQNSHWVYYMSYLINFSDVWAGLLAGRFVEDDVPEPEASYLNLIASELAATFAATGSTDHAVHTLSQPGDDDAHFDFSSWLKMEPFL